MKFTYLLVNLCSIAIPFAFSFESRIQFYKNWKALALALVIPAIIFIAWDSWFTSIGVWGFNPDYLTGSYIFNLPIEEILFFFCIPYACVFSYEVLNYFVKQDPFGKYGRYATTILTYTLLAVAIQYRELAYTSLTALLTFGFLLVHLTVLKKPYWNRLLLAYLVILVPFFITNGILTGTAWNLLGFVQ